MIDSQDIRINVRGAHIWLINRNSHAPDDLVDEAITDASSDGVNIVIIHSIATLGTKIYQIKNRIDRILGADMELHIVHNETTIAPSEQETITGELESMDRIALKLYRRKVHRDLVRELNEDKNKHCGRPGLGFTMDDRQRVKGPDFKIVRTVLKRVMLDDAHSGSLNKGEAAKELGCSRRTIDRALQRPHLYELPEEL